MKGTAVYHSDLGHFSHNYMYLSS